VKRTEQGPDDLLVSAVEAVIFASGEPVDPREIAQAFEDYILDNSGMMTGHDLNSYASNICDSVIWC
jgi:chromosome segregation and condensation protein ScpB